MSEGRLQMQAKVKDIITGYEGHVVSRVESYAAKDRYEVAAADGEGQPVSHWFDDGRLVEVK